MGGLFWIVLLTKLACRNQIVIIKDLNFLRQAILKIIVQTVDIFSISLDQIFRVPKYFQHKLAKVRADAIFRNLKRLFLQFHNGRARLITQKPSKSNPQNISVIIFFPKNMIILSASFNKINQRYLMLYKGQTSLQPSVKPRQK